MGFLTAVKHRFTLRDLGGSRLACGVGKIPIRRGAAYGGRGDCSASRDESFAV